jgi:hypothetical protein
VVVPQQVRFVSAQKVFIDTIEAIFKVATIAALVASILVNMK